jgi:hypothetical protein
MERISEEFVSKENKKFRFKIGKTLASALSGFLGGVIFISIGWGVTIYILYTMCQAGLK